MKKQPEITEATRQKIIASFWTLFKEREIEKITVNQLSAEAGIHRSSFYRYFPDMYAVFDAFEHQLLEAISTEIDTIRDGISNRDLKEYIDKTSVVLVKYAEPLYRLLNSSSGESLKKQLLVKLRENMLLMFDLSDSQKDVDYYVTFIGTIMLMNLNYWVEHRDQYTFSEISAKGQALVADGLIKLQTQRSR